MSIEEVRRKGEAAQANLKHYQSLLENPNLSFRARYAAQQLARSYAAAVKLSRKALAYEIEKAARKEAAHRLD